ncbi:diguanylate phosphodiesterase [Rhodospirillum sp. A1_3_36]|uniref:diguanylate phosphodiesterase n=1 Tax=Rhodospirillum sp. A1_3_36 TaxID=3391666 RepID=UPI0039A5E3DA
MDSTTLTDTTGDETSHEVRSLANLIAWLQDNLGRLLGYRAARLRLSKIWRSAPDALNPARTMLAELARDPEIKIFSLPQGDLLVTHHQTDGARVVETLEEIRLLFKKDPHCRQPILLGTDTPLVGWHVLGAEAESMLLWAERTLADHLNATGGEGALPGGGARLGAPAVRPGMPGHRGRPLTPEGLAKLENGLAMADLSTQVRRQRMVTIQPDGMPLPIGTELFINIGELRQTIAPQVDLFSNQWLFRRFTATLDQRMTTYIGGYVAAVDTPMVSLNLNVATILGPGFAAVRDAAKRHSDRIVVLELRLDDIMADLPAFLFAREHAHQLGFKVLIDNLGAQAMLWVDRQRLDADFLKAVWSPEMGHLLSTSDGDILRQRIRAFGPESIIMSRCDDAAAVEAGKALGCRIFQGFYLDDLLREGTPHNPQPNDLSPELAE